MVIRQMPRFVAHEMRHAPWQNAIEVRVSLVI